VPELSWSVTETIPVVEALRGKTDVFKRRIQEVIAEKKFPDPSTPEWYDLSFDEREAQRQERRKTQQAVLDEILPEAFADQDYLPERLKGRIYYHPTDRGLEAEIGQRLAKWRRRRVGTPS